MAYNPFGQFWANSITANYTDIYRERAGFEEGDLVEQTSNCSDTVAGQRYVVEIQSGQLVIGGHCTCQSQWKLIKKHYSSKSKPMESTSIKEKFINLFLSEPEKTFRKAGITNGDGMLTNAGCEIFLCWLLKKYGDDFKKEVVDVLPIEKENK